MVPGAGDTRREGFDSFTYLPIKGRRARIVQIASVCDAQCREPVDKHHDREAYDEAEQTI